MKKIMTILGATMIFASCTVETTSEKSLDEALNDLETSLNENLNELSSSEDVIKNELKLVLDNIKKGVKPMGKMEDIKKYDAKATEYLNNGVSTGSYTCDYDEGNFNIYKFYETSYNDKTELKNISIMISVLDDVIYDEETGEEDLTQALQFEKYIDIISKELGVQPSKLDTDEDDDYEWEKDGVLYYLSVYDDYTIDFDISQI